MEKFTDITVHAGAEVDRYSQRREKEIVLGEDGIHIIRPNGGRVFYPWFSVTKVVLSNSGR